MAKEMTRADAIRVELFEWLMFVEHRLTTFLGNRRNFYGLTKLHTSSEVKKMLKKVRRVYDDDTSAEFELDETLQVILDGGF